MWRKKETIKEEHVGCEHDECAECHHLIAKGTGQVVIEIYPVFSYYAAVSFPEERTIIYCELHKKPYDRFNASWAMRENEETKYEKRIEPWKRVNADGSDYVQPPSTT